MNAALRRQRNTRCLPGLMPGGVVARVCVLLRLWMASQRLWILSLCLLGLASGAQSAYLIQGATPATLTWSGAVAAVEASVVVTRYEKITLFRYAEGATPVTSPTVFSGNFASADSLSGSTPTLLGSLPEPLDSSGNPIPLDQPVPLIPADSGSGNQVSNSEPLFILIEQPALPPGAFGTRPDGRNFMATTLVVDGPSGTSSYIITLVETAPGSGDYAGYFMPSPSTPVLAGDTLSLDYDQYGDIDDSNTVNGPSFVSPVLVDSNALSKQASVSASAAPPSPSGRSLFLIKEAVRGQVTIGDIAPYRLKLINNGASVSNVKLVDTLPPGFRLRVNSVISNGNKLPATVDSDGRTVRITLASLGAGEEITVSYVADVTPLASVGVATNVAIARSAGDASNEARADITVEQPFFNDRAFLMGRVMVGECGDYSAEGLEGVRVYLEDGTNVVTDARGRWHLEGVRPGTHVVQVDDDSFSRRYSLKLCEDNSRKAGNARSRFVEVQGGTLWREDFWVDAKPEVNALLQQRMITDFRDGRAHVRLPISNGEAEFRKIEIRLFLPDNITPVHGSARINGQPVGDGSSVENYWLFELDGKGDYWQQELELDLDIDPGSTLTGNQSILAKTSGVTERGERYDLMSSNQILADAAQVETRELTLRPHFEPGSDTLSAEDKEMLAAIADSLRDYDGIRLYAVGHSDNVPFKRNSHGRAKNNKELSLIRAQAVVDQLAPLLGISGDAVTVEGAGEDFPIASNNREAGRALNRRVELVVIRDLRVKDANFSVVEGDSGINTTDAMQEGYAENEKQGFINLHESMKVSLPVLSVSAAMDSRLKPKLLLNGEEVSNDRLGMTLQDPDAGVTRYTWVGIDLKETGDYTFELQGTGPFGNVRFSDVATVTRTADLKSIKVLDSSGNVADGKTPVRVKLELIDDFGRKVESRTDLRLLSGNLRPLLPEGQQDPLNLKSHIVQVDSEGYAWFEPVSNAGTFRIRLASDKVESDDLEVSVDPYLRDWILVGFAKGTVGYNTLDHNSENIPDTEKDLYTDGESTFYARGRVKGSWLMTIAYDSQRQAGYNPHGEVLDPDAWYILYGDDTTRLHDAPSQEKLYLRLERKDFYVLFGDYQTDMTVTELSRYQRSLTGLKSEYQGRYLSANLFAAESGNGFIRDDIRGDGTSGLYRLTRQNLMPGTEQIRIEVRDRFNNEVLSSETRTRFIDYSIDYRTGTLFFREPIPVQDAQFNPIYIVVDYEVDAGEENVTGGGRVAVHTQDKSLEVGFSAVHEGTEGAAGDLGGVDLTWTPDDHHTLRAEGAFSDQEVALSSSSSQDRAWLLEHEYLSDRFDSRLRMEQRDGGFGLGQQAANDDDIRQSSAQGRYRFTEALSVNGELRRQEVLSNENTRDSAESTLQYDREDWRVYGGARRISDQVAGEQYLSNQMIAGAERDFLEDRLRLSAKGESSLGGEDNNTDYPKRLTLGADYRLNKLASLYTNQEMAWGHNYRSQETRTGVRATPWSGGTVTTEVGRAADEYGPRLFSHAGLYQTLQLNNQWSADVGFDRAQTLSDDTLNPTFDDRRPLASGTRSDDYTAASVGLGYRDGAWSLTNRAEFRHADTDDKISLLSGFQHRLDNVNTIAGRLFYFDRDFAGGEEEWEGQLDFSLVHRPLHGDWFVLNRTQLIMDALSDSNGDLRGRRLVNNTAANFKPSERQQLALNYGARYVMDTVDSERYTGYTDLIGVEYRYNLTRQWDVGARGSVMHGWRTNTMDVSSGVMVGFSPIRDVWMSLGYNFKGFYDADFTGAESRVGGIVFDFRIKFDQDTFRRNGD